jgi:hypothetical protein
MVDVPVARAPTVIAARCHPVAQELTPPLVGPHHRPGESLLRVDTHLGLLLCHDISFYLLIGIGPHFLRMR